MIEDGEGDDALCADCGPYLMGALAPDAVVAFEGHLTGCVVCQDECEALGPLVSALGHVAPDEAAAGGASP